MKILHIDSSILNEQSVSRQLTASIIRQLSERHSDVDIIQRDLVEESIGHLSTAEFLAFQGVEPQSDAAKEDTARNASVLNEFLTADVIIIGAPMYNLSLPS